MANSFHSSRLYGFFCELRRRKVYRVAAGYGVVGWLIIQFATTVLPVLTLPAWTARLVIVLVLAGFPIALILAWAFDVDSGGIIRTPDPKPAEERCKRPPALAFTNCGSIRSGIRSALIRGSSNCWQDLAARNSP